MTGLSIVIASEARQSSFLHKKCLWRLCSKREQLLFLQLSRPVNSSEMDRRASLAMTGAGCRHCERSAAIHAPAPRPNMDRHGLWPRDDGGLGCCVSLRAQRGNPCLVSPARQVLNKKEISVHDQNRYRGHRLRGFVQCRPAGAAQRGGGSGSGCGQGGCHFAGPFTHRGCRH